ncbi:hypothetical protein [Flavobacterium sp. F52]|uniref:hypothetical protein n=1 Tax=Flavobacterium sp. F52 TaxID=1202532 RepID=UPI000272EF5C|nr:hypothetical protein [Flavobacterium sp. F52]EJG01418.1 hypothetical protein FF52_10178 [Flavobacterium sp. F52]
MKKQKVVAVNVLSRTTGGENTGFKELEFSVINKYLDEGYKVVQVYQIAPSPQLYVVTITFILEKDDN